MDRPTLNARRASVPNFTAWVAPPDSAGEKTLEAARLATHAAASAATDLRRLLKTALSRLPTIAALQSLPEPVMDKPMAPQLPLPVTLSVGNELTPQQIAENAIQEADIRKRMEIRTQYNQAYARHIEMRSSIRSIFGVGGSGFG
jgi:hypothetical protein